MAYCTRADIEARHGVTNLDRWADLDSDDNAANITARITAAIVYADARIDSELRGGVYAVPFAVVPEESKGLSVEFAVWWLYQARPRTDNEADKGFDKMIEDSMKFLKRIKRGVVRFALAYKEIVPLVVKD